MSAGSAHAQIPTRVRVANLDDLLVDARRDDPEDADRLRDVLERLLAEALQDEVGADALGGGRADDDLAALGRAREASGDVGGGTGRREGPPLPRARAELGGADQGLAGVDPHVELDRRGGPAVLPGGGGPPPLGRDGRAGGGARVGGCAP